MPRANRHHLPHYVWHITHRCHRQQFLLKFARDRQAWIRSLYAARRRYALCVLDYAVTSNHAHLLLRDRGRGEIAGSMQLIAGRTAQAYNERKDRHGAFWEDRYHATAVETDEHLARCAVCIDLKVRPRRGRGVGVGPAPERGSPKRRPPLGRCEPAAATARRRLATITDYSLLRTASALDTVRPGPGSTSSSFTTPSCTIIA